MTPETITKEQAKDTGMALVLICLLLRIFTEIELFFGAAIGLLVVDMVTPQLFKPIARLWLGLSRVLGEVVSMILLTVLFFLLVTPIGILRRIFGGDALLLRQWKNGTESVFQHRDHVYRPDDLEKPF